jgi:HNH endonuclease
MSFKVSRRILSALPEGDRDKDALEARLWEKTGGVCFLCEDKINRAADDYEADHDDPEADGGPTTVENLNLAHAACNRMKRAAGSRFIRPYIKFARFVSKINGRIRYDGTLDFFDITPKPTAVTLTEDSARFDFADGPSRTVPIMRESNEVDEFEFVYVDVPRSAIFNDEECQPRVIRKEQVAAIYGDIRRNPLHEPPSLRMTRDGAGATHSLLMFDGQHKTIANWLMGRDRVVVKVYLNLSAEAAIELVNSIQAKIRKLPLSPFELASKLSEEWEDKLSRYEALVGEDNASEAGFIEWLPADDRTRAKQAFRAALVQRLLGNPELRLGQYAKGIKEDAVVELTEQGIRSKILEKLVFTDPLPQTGEALSEIRDREAANIIRILNHFTDAAFEPAADAYMTDVEKERARRIGYQQSLAYCSNLIRDLWGNIAMKSSAAKFALADELTEEQWQRLLAGVDRLVAHPAWTADFEVDDMQVLKIALEKNQQAQKAFEALALDLPYLLTGDKYPSFKKRWAAKK